MQLSVRCFQDARDAGVEHPVDDFLLRVECRWQRRPWSSRSEGL